MLSINLAWIEKNKSKIKGIFWTVFVPVLSSFLISAIYFPYKDIKEEIKQMSVQIEKNDEKLSGQIEKNDEKINALENKLGIHSYNIEDLVSMNKTTHDNQKNLKSHLIKSMERQGLGYEDYKELLKISLEMQDKISSLKSTIDSLYVSNTTRTEKNFQAINLPRNVNEIIGMPVTTNNGKKFGHISDVSIDNETGNIQFVTLLKEQENERVVAPLGAFRFNPDTGKASLVVSEKKLDSAPTQVMMSDEEFEKSLETHYGVATDFLKDSEKSERTKNEQKTETDPKSE